jgi:hypothetical protein
MVLLKSNQMEMFYDFCGVFDDMLRKDYRKSKAKEKGMTYPQFCVVIFANFMEEANDVLNIKKPKRYDTRKSKVAKMQSM